MPLQADVMQLAAPGPGAAPNAWNGVPNSDDQILFANNDNTNTWSLGFRNNITPGGANTIPLLPNSTVTLSANRTIYATAPAGTTPLVVIPGATAYFQTTTLTGLGGAQIFVQSTTPTGTIPLNSLWFNTTPPVSLQYWNGTTWVIQAFAGSQLIQAGTIIAALMAAGIVVAGIVDATTINGAKLRIKNSFGATILTVNILAGSWLLYNDLGSATQGALVASGAATGPVSDEFSNTVLGGVTFYGNPMAGVWIAANMNVASSDYGIIYFTASTPTGTWTIDSWLRRSGGNAGQLEIGPIVEILTTTLLPATPAGGAKLFVPSSTNTPRVLKLDGEPGYGIGESIYSTNADQTISAAWAVPISGGGVNLSFPVISGQVYYFTGTFWVNVSASFQIDLGVTGPAITNAQWFWQGHTSTTILGQTALTFVAPTPPAAGDYFAKIWGTFVPSANGTFSMGAGKVANNFTVKAGTELHLRTHH